MTLADIQADVLEYADFEEVASVSRAKLFITAAKRWLILCAESSSNQSSSLSIGKQYVSDMLKRAQAFVAQNTTGSGGQVRFLGPGVAFR
ncbi:MAG: hypothetical protein ACKO0Z_09635 [Betaproteobacteria bacterium]